METEYKFRNKEDSDLFYSRIKQLAYSVSGKTGKDPRTYASCDGKTVTISSELPKTGIENIIALLDKKHISFRRKDLSTSFSSQ